MGNFTQKITPTIILAASLIFLPGCYNNKATDSVIFATSAEYPPFEYQEQGSIKGFDIDLARLIAEELGKDAIFENMQFSSILPALAGELVDAAISTITITEERKKNFDFSDAYYVESMAVVFDDKQPIADKEQLSGKKIGCQLGTTMEIWLKAHISNAEIVTFDNNNQAIEALKARYVDLVLMDGIQGSIFSKKNIGLSYTIIAQSDNGYGIALKKGSPLKTQINQALRNLEATGEIKKLQEKWLKDTSWKK